MNTQEEHSKLLQAFTILSAIKTGQKDINTLSEAENILLKTYISETTMTCYMPQKVSKDKTCCNAKSRHRDKTVPPPINIDSL